MQCKSNELRGEEVSLKIFNPKGQLIQESRLSSNQNELNLDNASTGVYFFTIQTQSEATSGKFSIIR